MAESLQVTGLRELLAAMNALPGRIEKNLLNGAVGAGAAVLRNEAKLRAPIAVTVGKHVSPPGTLKRAIYSSKARKASSEHTVAFHIKAKQARNNGVGLKSVAAYGDMDAYYWWWVELGHYARNGVRVQARPYLRPAFEVKKMVALETIRAYIRKRLPLEIEKLRR
jgi:HK97 gp10 family phage protein